MHFQINFELYFSLFSILVAHSLLHLDQSIKVVNFFSLTVFYFIFLVSSWYSYSSVYFHLVFTYKNCPFMLLVYFLFYQFAKFIYSSAGLFP